MKCLKGGSISLPAYFESADGTPSTGTGDLSLANCLFNIYYTDATASPAAAAATRYKGNGWYTYDFTDTQNKNFIYTASDDSAVYKNFPGALVEVVDNELVSSVGAMPITDFTLVNIFTQALTSPTIIEGLCISMSTITKDTLIQVTNDIYGVDEVFHELTWVDGTDMDEVLVPTFVGDTAFKVFMTSTTPGEAAERAINYHYLLKVL